MLTIFLCVCKDTTFEAHRDERKNFFNTYNEKVFSACHKKANQTVIRMMAKYAELKNKKRKSIKKTRPSTMSRDPFLFAERGGFEPPKRFRRLHAFQA